MQAPDRLLYHGYDAKLYGPGDVLSNYPWFEYNAPYTRRLANNLMSPVDRPKPFRHAQARDIHSGSTARLQFSFGDSRKTRRQQLTDRHYTDQLWLQTTIETDRARQQRAAWLQEEIDEEEAAQNERVDY